MQCNCYCKKIHTYIYIYLHTCVTFFRWLLKNEAQGNSFGGLAAIVFLCIIEIRFRCHLLIGSCWQGCIQTSLQMRRCMQASSVSLIYQTLPSLEAQIESFASWQKKLFDDAVLSHSSRWLMAVSTRKKFPSPDQQDFETDRRLFDNCKMVNSCVARKGQGACEQDMESTCLQPFLLHSPRQHAWMHWAAALWLVNSCSWTGIPDRLSGERMYKQRFYKEAVSCLE